MLDLPFAAEALARWVVTLAIHSALLGGAALLLARAALGPASPGSPLPGPAGCPGAPRARLLKVALFAPLVSSALPWTFGGDLALLPSRAGSPTVSANPLATTMAHPAFARSPRHAAGDDSRSSAGSGLEPAHVPAQVAAPPRSNPAGWTGLAAAALLSLSIFRVARLELRRRRFMRSLRRTPQGNAAPLRLLSSDVRLTVSERLDVPTALSSSEVCVPAGCWSSLSPASRDALLAHELAHIERGDPGWFRFTAWLEAGLYFLPWVKPIASRFRRAAEYACDERAAQWVGSRLDVARCLSEVAAWRSGRSNSVAVPYALPSMVAAGASADDGTGHPVVARVEQLVGEPSSSESGARRVWPALALLGILACSAPEVVERDAESASARSDGAAARTAKGEITIEVDSQGRATATRSSRYPVLEALTCELDTRKGREGLVTWLRRAVEPLEKTPLGSGAGSQPALMVTEGALAIVAAPGTRFREVQRIMSLAADMRVLMPDIRLWSDGVEYPIPLPTDSGAAAAVEQASGQRRLDVRMDIEPEGQRRFAVTGTAGALVSVPEEIPEEEPIVEEAPTPAQSLKAASFSELRDELPSFVAGGSYSGASIDARRGTTVQDVVGVIELLTEHGVDRLVFLGSYER